MPSNELGELGIDIGKHVTPKSKRVKTSQLFLKASTWLVDGVGVGVLVTDGVIELVGDTVGVFVLVGVFVGVGVVVGVGQLTDAETFNFTTPLDGFV